MYTIALVLLLLWVLGALTTTSVTIHALLVIAILLALIRLVNQGGVEWVD